MLCSVSSSRCYVAASGDLGSTAMTACSCSFWPGCAADGGTPCTSSILRRCCAGIGISSCSSGDRSPDPVVNPDTLLRWHRDLFKIVRRRKSRPRGQPTRLAPEIVTLIEAMAKDNALWSGERISD